jgi:hypothetical protein
MERKQDQRGDGNPRGYKPGVWNGAPLISHTVCTFPNASLLTYLYNMADRTSTAQFQTSQASNTTVVPAGHRGITPVEELMQAAKNPTGHDDDTYGRLTTGSLQGTGIGAG